MIFTTNFDSRRNGNFGIDHFFWDGFVNDFNDDGAFS